MTFSLEFNSQPEIQGSGIKIFSDTQGPKTLYLMRDGKVNRNCVSEKQKSKSRKKMTWESNVGKE